MFNKVIKFLRLSKVPTISNKPIMFADGDQNLLFDKIKVSDFQRIHIVTCSPHITKAFQRALIKYGCLFTFTSLHTHNQEYKGKETTDKYIAIQLQKLISQGQTKFAIMSADADYYSIATMLIMSNPELTLDFTIYANSKYQMNKHERLKSKITTVFY